jgi:hypothetical protein
MPYGQLILAWTLLPAAVVAGAEEVQRTWDFEQDKTGQIAQGFTDDVGAWRIVEAGNGKVLMQTAKSENPVFNIALTTDTNAKDVDIAVDMKAIAGVLDQGGGLVWRAADAKNYYLARYNPLEDNYRLYTVVNGKRTMLGDAKITRTGGPHSLRVTMSGDRIECFFDGKRIHDRRDKTFAEAGKIGLWTKADAQTQFDNLTLHGK